MEERGQRDSEAARPEVVERASATDHARQIIRRTAALVRVPSRAAEVARRGVTQRLSGARFLCRMAARVAPPLAFTPRDSSMNIAEFINKWHRSECTERSGAQEHFLDLCEVFEHPKPGEVNPTGESFTSSSAAS